MKKTLLIIPVISTWLFGCEKEKSFTSTSTSTSNTNTSTQVDVYVAGADSVYEWAGLFNSTYGIAAYWKNGKPVNITRRSEDGYGPDGAMATSIAVSGADVYVTGYQRSCGGFSCGDIGRFW